VCNTDNELKPSCCTVGSRMNSVLKSSINVVNSSTFSLCRRPRAPAFTRTTVSRIYIKSQCSLGRGLVSLLRLTKRLNWAGRFPAPHPRESQFHVVRSACLSVNPWSVLVRRLVSIAAAATVLTAAFLAGAAPAYACTGHRHWNRPPTPVFWNLSDPGRLIN
jgi:hypothetical protein